MNVEIRSGVIRPVEVYKEAWSMIKGQFWMVFAVTFVGMMMAGIIPIIIAGPMIAGIFIVMFAVVDGGRADVLYLRSPPMVIRPEGNPNGRTQ